MPVPNNIAIVSQSAHTHEQIQTIQPQLIDKFNDLSDEPPAISYTRYLPGFLPVFPPAPGTH